MHAKPPPLVMVSLLGFMISWGANCRLGTLLELANTDSAGMAVVVASMAARKRKIETLFGFIFPSPNHLLLFMETALAIANQLAKWNIAPVNSGESNDAHQLSKQCGSLPHSSQLSQVA